MTPIDYGLALIVLLLIGLALLSWLLGLRHRWRERRAYRRMGLDTYQRPTKGQRK